MTLYDDLEITPQASSDDIRRAYRRLALQHHPDKNGNSAESTQRFQLITTAYNTLSDIDRRQQYDMVGTERTEDVNLNQMNEIFQQVFGQVFPQGIHIAHSFHHSFHTNIPIPIFTSSPIFTAFTSNLNSNPDIIEMVRIPMMDVYMKKRKRMTVRRRLISGQKEVVEVIFSCNQIVQEFEGLGHQIGPDRYGKIQIKLEIVDILEPYQIVDKIHLSRMVHISLEQFDKGHVIYKHLDNRYYQFNYNLEELRRQDVKMICAHGLGLELDDRQGDLQLELCVDGPCPNMN